MDEALKKFYFDLYDGEADGQEDAPGNADSQSFNIDEYFETNDDASINKQKTSYATDRSTQINQFPKQQLNQIPSNKQQFLPQPQKTFPPIVPSQSQPPAPVSSSSSAQDPTFVLSRLLFHLSQLPAAAQ